MKILCVDDDHIVAKPIIDALAKEFPGTQINWVGTESEFYSKFEQIATDHPSIVIMDVMKLWARASPNLQPPPEEIKKEGIYRAGIRCALRLNSDERTKDIPIILHTVLNQTDIEGDMTKLKNTHYLSKEGEGGTFSLIKKIRELLSI
ncbi:MAG TPA: hypothetical protein PLD20_15610 [Blastocatellia bacterium]|nr:hypothetical protein [Blastocatellia bacterium]HMX24263.1 hypothetical protein [Blastocatellia bacterium]HMZ19363.1 hypothetical protein [Blastocatellia bacterium]HNG29292.1 hypothetical protein [Blastocatellia bacterium]